MFKMSTASRHTSWQTTTPLTNRCLTSQWCHHWTQHCQVSKKNIYLPACLVHCDGTCQKLRNQMQNYLKYTNKTRGTFSGQSNLQFLSTKVLQGSVGTCVNYGRIFIDYFAANLLQSVMVKEVILKIGFRISRSYRQKQSGTFFSGHGVWMHQKTVYPPGFA